MPTTNGFSERLEDYHLTPEPAGRRGREPAERRHDERLRERSDDLGALRTAHPRGEVFMLLAVKRQHGIRKLLRVGRRLLRPQINKAIPSRPREVRVALTTSGR